MDSNRPMIYAPVIIPTLCRDKHFIRCMESLRRNPWAKYTEVYIGLDYPAKEEHWEGYRKISTYLEQPFPEFRAVHVFRREKNVGAAQNSRLLREEVRKQYDRYIYMEDDLEASPNFLEYMDKSLMEYETDPEVIAVTGYAYPLSWIIADNCTVAKQNFNGSVWGCGFWRAKETALRSYLQQNGLAKDFSHAYKAGRFNEMIDHAVMDYVTLCENGWSGKSGFLNRATDVAMRIYIGVHHSFFIMPSSSKIRNHGYDGSGLYCQMIEGNTHGEYCVENYQFSTQVIDVSDRFTLLEDKQFNIPVNRELLNQFDRVPPETMNVIWREAELIARRGRYGGALVSGKKVLKALKKTLSMQ